MIEFKILKKSKKSRARLGILKTSHGIVETPSLVPVATRAVVKTLTSEEAIDAKCQILIANTFHLYLKPGEKIIKKAGGLHKFMNWQKPLMTDSGGFQVFSLGFGMDYGTGKILKRNYGADVFPQEPAVGSLQRRTAALALAPTVPPTAGTKPVGAARHSFGNTSAPFEFQIKSGQQPKFLKITNDGVIFRSPIDGKELFLGPKESIKIQKSLGADIIFAFDECTSPIADYEYTKKSMGKTHNWAKQCLKYKKSKKQALFGIVQGGKFKDLRIESAKFIGSFDFDGFGIGGEFGDNKKTMVNMLRQTISYLPEAKPRHLLGIGHLEDIAKIIKEGVDLFDCTMPTHYARRGVAFTSGGKLDLLKSKFLNPPAGGKNPIDKKCSCFTCQNYRRDYICHLFRAKEITAMKLLTFHNLYFFNSFVEKIRSGICKGLI